MVNNKIENESSSVEISYAMVSIIYDLYLQTFICDKFKINLWDRYGKNLLIHFYNNNRIVRSPYL